MIGAYRGRPNSSASISNCLVSVESHPIIIPLLEAVMIPLPLLLLHMASTGVEWALIVRSSWLSRQMKSYPLNMPVTLKPSMKAMERAAYGFCSFQMQRSESTLPSLHVSMFTSFIQARRMA